MSDKSTDEIIMDIKRGLTGDPSADTPYLQEQITKYRDHEYAREILRECGRMLFEIMPEDDKKKFSEAADKELRRIGEKMKEVRDCIRRKDLAKAMTLLEGLLEPFERTAMFRDDSVSEYRFFQEPFEELLYLNLFNPEKEIRPLLQDISDMYYFYGNLLVEMKRYDEAAVYLRRAAEFCPTCTVIAFEFAETFKARGMFDEYEKMTRRIFKFSFRPGDVARCYRNIGYCFTERGMYHEAVCCYVFSLHFEHSPIVKTELLYIFQKNGNALDDPTIEEIKACFEANDIPYGPDEDILGMAFAFGKKAFDEHDKEAAEYYLSIIDDLVNDKNVRKMLHEVRSWGA